MHLVTVSLSQKQNCLLDTLTGNYFAILHRLYQIIYRSYYWSNFSIGKIPHGVVFWTSGTDIFCPGRFR